MKCHLVAVVAWLILVAAAPAAAAPQVGSERVFIPVDAASIEAWRGEGTVAKRGVEIRLPELASERIEEVWRLNAQPGIKALQIGLARWLDQDGPDAGRADLEWQPIADGQVAVLDVASPLAEGLRVGLDLAGLPDDAEIRVAGSAFPDLVYAVAAGEARGLVDDEGLFWTAVTDGEAQKVELFLPAGYDPSAVPAGVAGVSHLLVALHGDASLAKAMGDSGSCNVDAICRVAALGQHYVTAKDAVARMAFTSGGSSYTCTGTLLNDTDPSTTKLWFYSAHHCINTQTVANTLSTFWQYETPTCGSNQAGPNRQMTGGAALRYSAASSDALLLELNGSLPGGIPVTFAGWSAAALTAGTAVVAIHHPSGDRKKVSRGTFNRVSGISFSGQTVTSGWRVNWTEGTTEGGSSGSGLFTADSSSFYLRGGLAGGGASCGNVGQSDASGNYDVYSRFDQVYPNIQQYLNPAGGGTPSGPTRNYTGQWDVASEAGRGLSLFQFDNNVLFALWFVYDAQGRASWYQLDPSWTGEDRAGGRVVHWTGSPWGPTYNPNARSLTEVGTFSVHFTSATAASFTYNVDGVSRTVTLRKL